MPVGPSHGSRSGGSSSRSSGSRSSGSSSSSGSYRSSSRSSRHTTVYVGGGYYGGGRSRTPKEKKIIALVWGIIFASVILIIAASLFFDNVGPMNLIKQDAGEYAQIIERAQNQEEGYYIVEITNIKQSGCGHVGYDVYYNLSGSHDSYFTAYNYLKRNGIVYFYFEYSFVDSEWGRIYGESYASYSENAVTGLTGMTLAYTKAYDNDGSWDVIDVNYSLGKNIEYLSYKDSVIIGVILFIIALGLDSLFIYMIVRVVKNKKIFGKTATNATQTKTIQPTNNQKVCAYCGSIVDKYARRCSSCGAKMFKSKEWWVV